MKSKNYRFPDDIAKFHHLVKANSKEFSICSDRHFPQNILTCLPACYFFQNTISHFDFIFNSKEIWLRRDTRIRCIRVDCFTFHPRLERQWFVSKTCHFGQGWFFLDPQKCPSSSKSWALMTKPYQVDKEMQYKLCKWSISQLSFENSHKNTKFPDGCVTRFVLFSSDFIFFHFWSDLFMLVTIPDSSRDPLGQARIPSCWNSASKIWKNILHWSRSKVRFP